MKAARGVIIAAPHSGAGKTTVTLALLAALKRRGLVVRAAKAGPDYIDPAFHAAVTGSASVNLDSWAMPAELLDTLAAQTADGADMFVIEGVMGLFDGAPGAAGRSGATADLAAHFGLPVVLVLDVSRQAQSAAAVVRGFCRPRSRRAHRRRDPQSRRQRTPSRVRRRRHRRARHSRPRRHAARRRRWRCPSAISASFKPPSMPISPRFVERLAATAESHLDLDGIMACAGAACARAGEQGNTSSPAAAGPAHRARARPGFQLRLSAPDRRVATGGRRDPAVFAARRRAAARERRQLLAARRLSGAARRGARRRT